MAKCSTKETTKKRASAAKPRGGSKSAIAVRKAAKVRKINLLTDLEPSSLGKVEEGEAFSCV